jgi:hypothetical protein
VQTQKLERDKGISTVECVLSHWGLSPWLFVGYRSFSGGSPPMDAALQSLQIAASEHYCSALHSRTAAMVKPLMGALFISYAALQEHYHVRGRRMLYQYYPAIRDYGSTYR